MKNDQKEKSQGNPEDQKIRELKKKLNLGQIKLNKGSFATPTHSDASKRNDLFQQPLLITEKQKLPQMMSPSIMSPRMMDNNSRTPMQMSSKEQGISNTMPMPQKQTSFVLKPNLLKQMEQQFSSQNTSVQGSQKQDDVLRLMENQSSLIKQRKRFQAGATPNSNQPNVSNTNPILLSTRESSVNKDDALQLNNVKIKSNYHQAESQKQKEMIVKAHERYRNIKIKKNKKEMKQQIVLTQGTSDQIKEEDDSPIKLQEMQDLQNSQDLEQEVENAFEDDPVPAASQKQDRTSSKEDSDLKLKSTDILNINMEQDDEQMQLRGFPTVGNKRAVEEEDGEEVVSYITDADLVKSDFEEYRALGVPSIDSWTMQQTDIQDVEKNSDMDQIGQRSMDDMEDDFQ